MPRARLPQVASTLLMVVVAALALLGAGARGVASPATASLWPASEWRDQPAIEAQERPPAGEARERESLRIVSVGASTLRHATNSGASIATAARACGPARAAAERRWCDVVQCRRLGGAHVLHFATPPPAHG
jgi:hypothetical protein